MIEIKNIMEEENLVSLRSAIVQDDGYVVSLMLTARKEITSTSKFNFAKAGFTYLYRRRRSCFARMSLAPRGATQKHLFQTGSTTQRKRGVRGWISYFAYRRLLISLEADIKQIEFPCQPELKLLWKDSGHSVALHLNGEPWAFILAEKNHGYSKGILRPTIGNPWDQTLFESIFR
jgi:hypothetical protein